MHNNSRKNIKNHGCLVLIRKMCRYLFCHGAHASHGTSIVHSSAAINSSKTIVTLYIRLNYYNTSSLVRILALSPLSSPLLSRRSPSSPTPSPPSPRPLVFPCPPWSTVFPAVAPAADVVDAKYPDGEERRGCGDAPTVILASLKPVGVAGESELCRPLSPHPPSSLLPLAIDDAVVGVVAGKGAAVAAAVVMLVVVVVLLSCDGGGGVCCDSLRIVSLVVFAAGLVFLLLPLLAPEENSDLLGRPG